MVISSRTPEGLPNYCPVCDAHFLLEPSDPAGDAPCPNCGHLVWFSMADRRVCEPAPRQSEPYRADVPADSVVIQHAHPVAAGNGPGRVTRRAVCLHQAGGSCDLGVDLRRGLLALREIARCPELTSPTMQREAISLIVITCLVASLGYCAAGLISLFIRRAAHHGPELISGASATGDLWDRQLDG